MSDDLLGDDVSPMQSLIQTLFFHNDIQIKLNGMDSILSSLDDEIAKKLKAKEFRAYLHKKYLDDVQFMRRLKFYSTICSNHELSMEYFSQQEFLSHQEFNFDPKLEKELADLNKILNEFAGKLLKEYTKGGELDI